MVFIKINIGIIVNINNNNVYSVKKPCYLAADSEPWEARSIEFQAAE